MKIKIWLALGTLVLAILLAACAGTATVPSTPTASALLPSPTPSLTFLPAISSPTFTPTITPKAVDPSATPTTVLTVLPLVTSQFANGVGTSIPTPGLGPESYQLKDWSETNALGMIRSIEQYANLDHNHGSLGQIVYSNQQDYKLVELAVREMQFRFPTSQYQAQLNWRLALAQYYAAEPVADAWLLNEIETGLNQKRFTPANINPGLVPYGFQVSEQVVAKNLFGHNDDSIVYHVGPIIFAIRGKTPGNYKIIKITSSHSVRLIAGYNFDDYSEIPEVEAQDHNGNSLSEITAEEKYASPTSCYSTWVLDYEWNGSSFVDLTHGNIESQQCEMWSFGQPGSAEAGTLHIYSGNLINSIDQYKWNGTYYQLAESQLQHDQYSHCGTIMDAAYDTDYSRAILASKSVLQNWTDEDFASLGASCRDYLRVKIGILYALSHHPNEARTMLQEVASSFKFSPVTTAFLQNYQSENDLYQACRAAQTVLSKAYMDDPNDDAWIGKNSSLYLANPTALCRLDETFPFLVRSLQGADVSNPLAAFQRNGVEIGVSRQLDIDGDRVPDWLVDIDPETSSMDLWGLLTTSQGLLPVQINSNMNSNSLSDQDSFKADTYQMPGTSNFFLISSFDDLVLSQVKRTSTSPVVSEALVDYGLASHQYSFQQTATHGMELEISYGEGAPMFYRWDGASDKFQPLPLYEKNIFTAGGPSEYLPYLQRIVTGVDAEDYRKPQFLYLLALAYELTNDKTQAANLYWQICHDYSDTGYAVMAQSKIETTSP